MNYDGSLLESIKVMTGNTPTYSGATPTKEATTQYTYEFKGWSPEVIAVEGDATYIAEFDSIVNKYTITWLNDDNTQIDQTTVEYGVVPTHADATKEKTAEWSYTFAGWDIEPVAVTGEATYKATFSSTKNKYTITWLNDDNSQIDQTSVEYGVVPTHADATKENTAEYSYTFTGWNIEPVAVTGEATYKATFSATKNKYAITWLNDDNTQLDQTDVEYGSKPTYTGDTPNKLSTPEYTYTFSGWIPEITSVTAAATYTATFSATKNKYLITWLYDDGTEIDHSMVEYGTIPTPADAAKPATAQYTFTFKGWNKTVAPVTGEETYTAVYDSVVNHYTVIFYYEDGVTEIERKDLAYGETPSTAFVPTLQGNEQYTYEFAGWSPEIAPVTGNATYTAVFNAVPRPYTIVFKNYNGKELLTLQVPYGTIPEYTGETPLRPNTAKYTYTFSGWTPELTAVTGNATYTAVFEGVINTYTIVFYDEDGTELDRQEVAYGERPVYAGETPTKADDEEHTYTFAGWTPRIAVVTGDAAYTATYTATKKTHEGWTDVEADEAATKVIIEGKIYIRRGGHTYTLDGVLVE